MRQTYSVHYANLAGLEAQVEGLNKRARRIGMPEILLSRGETSVIRKVTEDGRKYDVVRVAVTIEGQEPRIDGWRFAATLSHEDGGTFIRSVPGFHPKPIYRNALPECEHCLTARRRNDTFLLEHDDGRVKQVGRNCLKDFLGHDNPHALAEAAEHLMLACQAASQGEMEEGGGGGGASACSLDTYLSAVAATIRERGWLSRSKAHDEGLLPTADIAWGVVFSPGRHDPVVTAGDVQRADEALTLARTKLDGMAPEAISDYEHNLHVVILGNYVNAKMAGVAASLISYAERERELQLQRAHIASGSLTHQGTIGDRQMTLLTVISMQTYNSDYGVTTYVNLRDAAGNHWLWKASGNPEAETLSDGQVIYQGLKQGETYEVIGSIKEHRTNNRTGAPETVITRCDVGTIGTAARRDAAKAAEKERKKAEAKAKRAQKRLDDAAQ